MSNNDILLKKFSEEIKKESQHEGELKDILNDEYISNNTTYNNYEDFIKSLPINLAETGTNLQELKNEELDNHINNITKSTSWIQFLNKGIEIFTAKKLKKLFK